MLKKIIESRSKILKIIIYSEQLKQFDQVSGFSNREKRREKNLYVEIKIEEKKIHSEQLKLSDSEKLFLV